MVIGYLMVLCNEKHLQPEQTKQRGGANNV
jgi:hypothetical protein